MKKKTIIITSVVLGVLVVVGVGTGAVLATISRGGAFMHHPEMWGRGARGLGYWRLVGAAPFLLFGLLLMLAAVAILGFLAIKRFAYNKTAHPVSGSNALDILQERYAKGEVTKEEFEAIKKDILD